MARSVRPVKTIPSGSPSLMAVAVVVFRYFVSASSGRCISATETRSLRGSDVSSRMEDQFPPPTNAIIALAYGSSRSSAMILHVSFQSSL